MECLKAGRKSGDLVHALPYAPDLHFGDLKSAIADMTNVEGSGKYVGPPSSTAGLFIAKHIDFSDSVNWLISILLHLLGVAIGLLALELRC
uniref:Cytosol aminopeptidase domain-containing protein n=1 Tax=Ditylenchus dipsaci TaxID=166011 RepID=A0A915CQI9_9BILA